MLCVIGGGKMGRALAQGLLQDGSTEITIVERNEERLAQLHEWARAYSGVSIVSNADDAGGSEGAVIAVKPKDVELAVSDAIGSGAQRILSIAAGVSVARLHEWAGGRIPVLRAMPNIGAVVGQSASALCAGSTAHAEDVAWAEGVLRACGDVVQVTEDQMDAVTGVSGSGPAYLFLVAEAMIDAGVGAGLQRSVARDLTVRTFQAAAALLDTSGKTPGELRADVTTPAGTTAAALRALEHGAVRAAFFDAVSAAAERSRELGASPTSH